MSLVIIGLPALNKRLAAIGDTRTLLRDIQIRSVREAKLRVPRKTGFLGRSIIPGEVTKDHAIVEANANYAAYVERGTRAHIIRPRNRRSLAWPATEAGRRLSGRARSATRRGGNGGMIFARLVHHPGTRPEPFLVPGVQAALKQVGVEPIVKAWNDAS